VSPVSRDFRTLVLIMAVVSVFTIVRARAASLGSLRGPREDASNKPVSTAQVRLYTAPLTREYTDPTSATGEFRLEDLAPGVYELTVEFDGRTCTAAAPVMIREGVTLTMRLQICSKQEPLRTVGPGTSPSEAGGASVSQASRCRAYL
jgi:hypothetical protein